MGQKNRQCNRCNFRSGWEFAGRREKSENGSDDDGPPLTKLGLQRMAADRPKRTPVATERLEADRRAMQLKVARLQAEAIALQGKKALRLQSHVVKGGYPTTGPAHGGQERPGAPDVRRATATAWQKRRPASAGSARSGMPVSMRKALRRGSAKADAAVVREFTPTVTQPRFRSSAAPQPAPDESTLRQLIAAAGSPTLATSSRAGSPIGSARSESGGESEPRAAWSPGRASRDSTLHFSPQRRRNPGLATGSPPWPLHRVAVSQAVAESLSLRDESRDLLAARSTSLAEYQERHRIPSPGYGVGYLADHDAYLDERDGSWRRRERKPGLPSADDAAALAQLLRDGMGEAGYRADSSSSNSGAQPQLQPQGAGAESGGGDSRDHRLAENVLAKVFEELSTVCPFSLVGVGSAI
jgi:hypothetical protein